MSKVVHFEIPVDDHDRAATFYRSVFGWEVSGFGTQPYWLVQAGDDDEAGVNGALIARGEVHVTPVVVIAVDDLEEALVRAQAGGGRVLHGRLPVPGVGWSAYVADPEGNTIGLFQQDPGAA